VRNVKLPGGTHEVGARQGYDGISVLPGREVATIGGKDVEVDTCGYPDLSVETAPRRVMLNRIRVWRLGSMGAKKWTPVDIGGQFSVATGYQMDGWYFPRPLMPDEQKLMREFTLQAIASPEYADELDRRGGLTTAIGE
jgi:hypothetical protein